jgi:hypothetical protein
MYISYGPKSHDLYLLLAMMVLVRKYTHFLFCVHWTYDNYDANSSNSSIKISFIISFNFTWPLPRQPLKYIGISSNLLYELLAIWTINMREPL